MPCWLSSINCPSTGGAPTASLPTLTRVRACPSCVIVPPGITACPPLRNMLRRCESSTREEMAMAQLYDCRDAFAAALEDIATHDLRICAVVNDSVGSSKVADFGKRFPERLINV